MTVAVHAGSFDPITCGHVDVIARAARLFDRLVVGVFDRPKKAVVFPVEERVEMVRQSVIAFDNVEVMPYTGLTVHFARDIGAQVLVRGLRAISDFEYEFQQAALNRKMLPGLEVVCLFASMEYEFLSSSIIKEIAENGGDVSSMVPEPVARRLEQRFAADPRVPSGR